MATRAAAARRAAFLQSSFGGERKDEAGLDLPTVSGSLRKVNTAESGNKTVQRDMAHEENDGDLEEEDRIESNTVVKEAAINDFLVEKKPTPDTKNKKRKIGALKNKTSSILATQLVKGGWDELPHNMGKIGSGTTSNETLEAKDPEITEARPKKRARKAKSVKTETSQNNDTLEEDVFEYEAKSANSKERRSTVKDKAHCKPKTAQTVTPESPDNAELDPITEELKQEFKEEYNENIKLLESINFKDKKLKRGRQPRAKKSNVSSDVQQKVGDILDAVDMQPKKIKKGKANPYGLTPGQSPFPDFIMPTVKACKQVEDALSEVHGKVAAPKEIPAPSLEVTGCGEVPSVLDALIRTRLSASTTSQNAKYAFTGLVERYGVLEQGIGAGSVDWNKVRESDVLEIEKAIKKGGLAKTKSISIKKILEMVYEQNLARRDAFIKEKESGVTSRVIGAEKMTQGQKDMEIDVANKKILSLDFMHGLTADEAMMEFTKYPGIGVKTASCVILFCLQRPSFAVDTHVWRFCKWLKWVPEGATRDQTFSHCEVRIPNEMKYSLHQLFIRHGKTCGRCRAITGEGSEGWESTVCPLEHLVERTGKRKATGPPKKLAVNKKASKGKGGKKIDEGEVEMSDLTDVDEPELDDNEEKEGSGAEQSLGEQVE